MQLNCMQNTYIQLCTLDHNAKGRAHSRHPFSFPALLPDAIRVLRENKLILPCRLPRCP